MLQLLIGNEKCDTVDNQITKKEKKIQFEFLVLFCSQLSFFSLLPMLHASKRQQDRAESRTSGMESPCSTSSTRNSRLDIKYQAK